MRAKRCARRSNPGILLTFLDQYFAVAPSIRYPLDTYEINAAFGARDFANNTIPIVSANLIGNLQVCAHEERTGLDEPDRSVQGWQVRSNDTVMDYEGLNFSYDSGRFLTLSISRARAVVVFVVLCARDARLGTSVLTVRCSILIVMCASRRRHRR
jgi:hypothetical protein